MKRRFAFDALHKQKGSRKVSIIIGPRQVGKTTLLRALHHELGGLIFDTELFSEYQQIASYEQAIETFTIRGGYHEKQQKTFFVFIDEFQRYQELARVMKSIYDHHENIKIFATGSSSLGIKSAVQESLAGRKITTELYPFSFREFLFFKDREDLLAPLDRFGALTSSENYLASIPEIKPFLEEFLLFGGYPEAVLSETSEAKQEALRSIFDLYIKKDFAEFARVEKLRQAGDLLRMLAINNGQPVNYAQYGSDTGLDTRTIKNYLAILEETYILSLLHPYSTNKIGEITKMPKCYFVDNGVRNFFAGGFAPLATRGDTGFLFEGFYISELLKRGVDREVVKYYRTKSGDEIDVIIDRPPLLFPIEIKHQKNLSVRDVSAVSRFIETNGLDRGAVVTVGSIRTKGPLSFIDCFRDPLA